MKVIELDIMVHLIRPAYLNTRTWRGFLAYQIGNEKFGKYKIPLKVSDYPVSCHIEKDWRSEHFNLNKIEQRDKFGNELFYLSKGKDNGKNLVLVTTEPGDFGIVDFRVYGDCETIARVAVSVRDCTVGWNGAVLVHGPCRIEVKRTGMILSSYPSQIFATYDGRKWVLDYDIDFLPPDRKVFEI
ncbi:MAG: hypothetical protein ABIK73_07820 [candidate division WOR-3 bacterium]